MAGRHEHHIFAKDLDWERSPGGSRFVALRTDTSDDNKPLLAIIEYPPDYVVPAHTHGCSYVEYIIEGEVRIGKIAYGPGDVRIVQGGAGYGPLHFGSAGCRAAILFDRADSAAIELLPRGKPTGEQMIP
jgi:hypothetical protein